MPSACWFESSLGHQDLTDNAKCGVIFYNLTNASCPLNSGVLKCQKSIRLGYLFIYFYRYDIINNDDLLGEILFYFFSLNDEYLNDDKLKNLRNSGNREKVKVLKKYDPFYEIDREILK